VHVGIIAFDIDEVLDLAKSSGIKFNTEIKSSPDWPANYGVVPEEASRLVVDAVGTR
jgi:hypothetical protein